MFLIFGGQLGNIRVSAVEMRLGMFELLTKRDFKAWRNFTSVRKYQVGTTVLIMRLMFVPNFCSPFFLSMIYLIFWNCQLYLKKLSNHPFPLSPYILITTNEIKKPTEYLLPKLSNKVKNFSPLKNFHRSRLSSLKSIRKYEKYWNGIVHINNRYIVGFTVISEITNVVGLIEYFQKMWSNFQLGLKVYNVLLKNPKEELLKGLQKLRIFRTKRVVFCIDIF